MTRSGKERRRDVRKPVRVPVKITYEGDSPQEAISINSTGVSEGGLSVELTENLEIRDEILLEFSLPGSSEVLRARGRVVYIIAGNIDDLEMMSLGVGIRFIEIPRAARQAVAAFVE